MGALALEDHTMGTAAIFRDCRSFEYALDLLADEARSLGFDAIDYAFMPVARNGDGQWNAPNIASRNFPPRWAQGWARYASLKIRDTHRIDAPAATRSMSG